MANVISVILTANTTSFSAAMARAAAQTKTFGQQTEESSRRSTGAMQGISKVALGVGVGMLAGFGAAAGAAMRFDEQMSATGAAAGATGSQLNALREQALQMGADTSFSAREAAAAQEELAKAGLSTSEILGGALPAALTLAASQSLDLATASTYMADTLTQFNLEAGDASHVADVLAAAAGKSSTDVDGLSQAMNQVALVANQMGVGLEETAGALALFASEGLKGSDAGTSLKTALQRLANPSAEAADLMQQLGIDVFNSQGNFVGLAGTAAELQSALAGMTVEQRSAVLAQIGGADAVRSLSILYEAGASGVNRWTGAVNDTGYAAEQADARLDNLAGDLEALGGSLETALIEGGSKATGALRFLVQGATDAINVFSEMPGAVQTGIVAFAGVGGAILTLVGGIGLVVPRIQAGIAALEAMGAAGHVAAAGVRTFGAATVAIGKVGLVVGGLLALREVIGAVGDEAQHADLSKMERDLLRLGETGRFAGEDLTSAMADIREAMSAGGSPEDLSRGGAFDQARASLEDLDDALAQLAARDPGQATAAFRAIKSELVDMGVPVEIIEQAFDRYQAALAESETANESAEGAISGATGAVNEQGEAVNATAEAIQTYRDALAAMTDPVFGMTSALQGQRDAQAEVAAAELELAAAREAGNPLEVMAAEQALRDSRSGAVEAAFDLEQAEAELAAALAENPGLVDQVNAKLDEFVARGVLTTDQANQMAESLGIYAERANQVPERIESTAELNDEVSTPLQEMQARMLGWDGTTGTASAFLEDYASTPMGALTLQALGWDQTTATATADVDEQPAYGGILGATQFLNTYGTRTGTATADVDPGPAYGGILGATQFLNTFGNQTGTATADANNAPARRSITTAQGWLSSYGASSGTADANVNDRASGPLAAIVGLLNDVDGRTASSTVTVTHRTVFEEQRRGLTTGGPQLRWGGIYDPDTGVVHAQTGFLSAYVANQPTVHFGERATGGEAYIPRRGDMDRSVGILETAAGWYGMAVVPKDMLAAQAGMLLGAASPPGAPPMIDNSITYAPNVTVKVNAGDVVGDAGSLVKAIRSEVGPLLAEERRSLARQLKVRGR